MVFISRNTITHSILGYLDDLEDACRDHYYNIKIINDILKYDDSVSRTIGVICRMYDYYMPCPSDDFLLIWETR